MEQWNVGYEKWTMVKVYFRVNAIYLKQILL